MYPVFRLAAGVMRARSAPHLGVLGTHVSRHICWPWDLDPWRELNNGRTLTLFDLGRVPAFHRLGLVGVMRRNGWQAAVAGVSVRYRRRVRAFDRIVIESRMIGWDPRFWYVEQSMWRGDECTTHMLLRGAVTGQGGLVDPALVVGALGHRAPSPALPDWVTAWIKADASRPWPPERNGD